MKENLEGKLFEFWKHRFPDQSECKKYKGFWDIKREPMKCGRLIRAILRENGVQFEEVERFFCSCVFCVVFLHEM